MRNFLKRLIILSFIGNLSLILVSDIWALLRLSLRVTQRPPRLGFSSPFTAFKNLAMESFPQKCLSCLGAKFFLLVLVTLKCIIEVKYQGTLSLKEKGSLQVWWGEQTENIPWYLKSVSHLKSLKSSVIVLLAQHQLMWEGVKSSPISVPSEKSSPSGVLALLHWVC